MIVTNLLMVITDLPLLLCLCFPRQVAERCRQMGALQAGYITADLTRVMDAARVVHVSRAIAHANKQQYKYLFKYIRMCRYIYININGYKVRKCAE